MNYSSIPTNAPAVFVFDPATGDAVSLNSGAVQLIDRFGLAAAPRLTLAAIERSVMAGAKTKSYPIVSRGLAKAASELRRECRRLDGSVLALSRVWAPGTSTMLVVEDLTIAMQEHRRRRIWNMMVTHLAEMEDVTRVTDKALRTFCLLSRSSSGEIWLLEDDVLVRRSSRSPSMAASTPAQALRKKSADDSVVGQAWASGKTIHVANQVAIPMFAGTTLVAILALEASPACASDLLAFALIESLAPLFGLALLTIRHGEELSAAKPLTPKSSRVESERMGRSAARPKNTNVLATLRAAG